MKRTREELEAEEIEKMQAESRKKLREHRKTFHRLADSGKKPAKVMKHSKPTTESVGFKFRTERRVRQRRSAAAASSSRPPPPPPQSSRSHASNFPMTLRSSANTTLPTEVTYTSCIARNNIHMHSKISFLNFSGSLLLYYAVYIMMLHFPCSLKVLGRQQKLNHSTSVSPLASQRRLPPRERRRKMATSQQRSTFSDSRRAPQRDSAHSPGSPCVVLVSLWRMSFRKAAVPAVKVAELPRAA